MHINICVCLYVYKHIDTHTMPVVGEGRLFFGSRQYISYEKRWGDMKRNVLYNYDPANIPTHLPSAFKPRAKDKDLQRV